MKFWPLLGCIGPKPIFLIALYKGLQDPTCAVDYCKDFIDEILVYLHSGIELHGRTYSLKLHCILADAPARAFILNMKRHTGKFSCSKCQIQGIWSDGRKFFPMVETLVQR